MAVSMDEATLAVREMLDREEIRYDYRSDQNIFLINMGLKRTKIRSSTVIISVKPSRRNSGNCLGFLSYAMVGIKADDDCMVEMAEFLHRANYGLTFGNFELDFDDGEIRYKMSINSVDELPGHDAIQDLLYVPMSMIERYGNGILAISLGVSSAEDAIKKIEDD